MQMTLINIVHYKSKKQEQEGLIEKCLWNLRCVHLSQKGELLYSFNREW